MSRRPRLRPMNTAGLAVILVLAVLLATVPALLAGSVRGAVANLATGTVVAVGLVLWARRSVRRYESERRERPQGASPAADGHALTQLERANIVVAAARSMAVAEVDAIFSGIAAGGAWYAAENVSSGFAVPAMAVGIGFLALGMRFLLAWRRYRRVWAEHGHHLDVPPWARYNPITSLRRAGYMIEPGPGLLSTPVMTLRTVVVAAMWLGLVAVWIVTRFHG